jgi:hypothetical protein
MDEAFNHMISHVMGLSKVECRLDFSIVCVQRFCNTKNMCEIYFHSIYVILIRYPLGLMGPTMLLGATCAPLDHFFFIKINKCILKYFLYIFQKKH